MSVCVSDWVQTSTSQTTRRQPHSQWRNVMRPGELHPGWELHWSCEITTGIFILQKSPGIQWKTRLWSGLFWKLTLWRPLLPYVTAIKHLMPDRVKPSFVIFDIWALWRSRLSVRVPGCQKLQMTDKPVWHRMLYSCYPYGNSGRQIVNYFCQGQEIPMCHVSSESNKNLLTWDVVDNGQSGWGLNFRQESY